MNKEEEDEFWVINSRPEVGREEVFILEDIFVRVLGNLGHLGMISLEELEEFKYPWKY